MANLPYRSSAWYTHGQTGQYRRIFPYKDNANLFLIQRRYAGPIANYAAPTMLAADAVFTSHYLVEVNDVEPQDGSDLVLYNRTFAPVPAARTTYGSLAAFRPSLDSVLVNNFFGVSWDDDVTSHIIANGSRTAVTSGMIASNASIFFRDYLVYHSSHGKTAGERYAAWSGDTLTARGAIAYVWNTDAYVIRAEDILRGEGSNISYAGYPSSAAARVRNGSFVFNTKELTTFGLPSITVDISTPLDIFLPPSQLDSVSWLGAITETTLTGVTATAASDLLTKTGHGLSTGDTVVILDLGTGAAGLGLRTQYWVIRADADNFYLASSYANARAGVGAGISSDSTGMSILVPSPFPVIADSRLERWLDTEIHAQTTIYGQMARALQLVDVNA